MKAMVKRFVHKIPYLAQFSVLWRCGVARGEWDGAARSRHARYTYVIRAIAYVMVRGRYFNPCPLFDSRWYLSVYPDVAANSFNPFVHYFLYGAKEGRNPHPLFDGKWYLENNPDVRKANVNPLRHFLTQGASEGRAPHPMFDSQWYLEQILSRADAAQNPVLHYLKTWALEGKDPSPFFDTAWYLAQNPDVAAAGVNPLVHYIKNGRFEGRQPAPPDRLSATPLGRAIDRYRDNQAAEAAALLDLQRAGFQRILHTLGPAQPLSLFVDPRFNASPTLRILLPSLQARHATGGPNTAYILGAMLAENGIPVSFVATDAALDDDLGLIKEHLHRLTGLCPDEFGIRFSSAADRERAFGMGYNDVLLATAWWTAESARAATALLKHKHIYYLIQDYETMFYGAEERHVRAEHTYSIDHVPIINTAFLRDHLAARAVGRYASPEFARGALTFEPAIDRSHFYPQRRKKGPRRLLFYARPTVAARNLFALGVTVLRSAVQRGIFDDAGWEFVGMGERFEPVSLGRGYTLTPAPWLGFEAYAEQMREADILLSLMLSPHPSYPPLEMAACGGVAVTTVFGSKTADRLASLSPNILGAKPEIDDLLLALVRARIMSDDPQRRIRASNLRLAGSWKDSLTDVVTKLTKRLEADGVTTWQNRPQLGEPQSIVRANEEVPGSNGFLSVRARRRVKEYVEGDGDGLLSLVTTVYDTDPSYVADLAHTILGQQTKANFEWLILDNGSTNDETRAILWEIAHDKRVRLERVERNLGIVGGMRWCLEQASGQYILPVDSDDLLFPDCIRVVSSFLEKAGYPLIAYTDEDKTDGDHQRDQYWKPDWDPVLFTHSCYIAHLTVIDRKTALSLGCYTDPQTEGCHDWDTFIRFLNAGHRPAHIPEVLYSWRMHAASTSSNFRAKPYIYASHAIALTRFLSGQGKTGAYEIVPSPLFGGTPDYRFKRRPRRAVAMAMSGGDVDLDEDAAERLEVKVVHTLRLGESVLPNRLKAEVNVLPDGIRYVHLLGDHCSPTSDDFIDEACAHFDLFPDTVIVGGRIHADEVLREGGYVFGYAGGMGCPDAGRRLSDPGYFAQAWKPRSVAAVSARHCVVERRFLTESLGQIPAKLPLMMLGPWLGALARRANSRVVYTPFVDARVPSDVTLAISDNDLTQFNAIFGGLSRDPVGYAPHLDRSGKRPYQPCSERSDPKRKRLPYEKYLASHVDRRYAAIEPTLASGEPTISILTTVYERTDTRLFRKTAASVRSQLHAATEWVVLAHGPIGRDLDSTLREFGSEGLIRVLRHEVNLGIHGGLHYCLERAVGEFAFCLDADDLLTPDALAVLAAAAKNAPKTDIFYSDEDLLVDGALRNPYYRPDFDPVLLLAHSYVWHAILFRTSIALSLGAFTSKSAEYAQDWDLMLRFARAGHTPEHIPEVLYHWRQHSRSLSNSGSTFTGSTDSVLAVLEGIRQQHGADRYEVAPHPFNMGAPDYYVKRLPVDVPTVALLSLGGDAMGQPGFPFSERVAVAAHRGPSGVQALMAAVSQCSSEFVMAVGHAALAIDDESIWNALRHFEFVPDVVAVGGPLIDLSGRVLRGTVVRYARDVLVDPVAQRVMTDPGAGSIALKPHCVEAVTPDSLIVRRQFMLDTLQAAPSQLALRSLGAWMGVFASQRCKRLVYEPLLRAFVKDESELLGDDVDGLQITWTNLLAPFVRTDEPTRGLAGFARHADLHE